MNRPSERTSPKKRKHRDDFHLLGANSLNNRLWGTPVKGYFLLSLNGDRHVVLRATIQVSLELVVARYGGRWSRSAITCSERACRRAANQVVCVRTHHDGRRKRVAEGTVLLGADVPTGARA